MSLEEPRITDGCNEPDGPDYLSVDLPSKPPEEYNYRERRARLLQLITEHGHPDAINQTEMADRFGVSQQQISKDLQRLGEYVHGQVLDRNQRALIVQSVTNRALRGLLDDGEYRKAAKTAMEYDEWATEFIDLSEMAAEIDRLKQQQNNDT
jgi:DeoR/GlpR family transcriptional regulator of sugar metabolism